MDRCRTYANGTAITVLDFTGRWFSALGPVRLAWLCSLADRNAYEIIWIEPQSLFLNFTLTENMGQTVLNQASCTFDNYWQGLPTGANGAAGTVFDPNRNWAGALNGDHGVACWNNQLNQYTVTAMPFDIFQATVLLPIPRGGSANANLGVFVLGQWEPSGKIVSANDSSKLGPIAQNSLVWVFNSRKSGRWEILSAASGGQPIFFYLNGPLTQGGSASAQMLVWNPAALAWDVSATAITVWDTANFGPAAQGISGVAFLSSTSGRYEIISLPPGGGGTSRTFILTAPIVAEQLIGATQTAIETVWNEDDENYNPGDPMIVHDPTGGMSCPTAASGVATLVNGVWEIQSCQRIARRLEFFALTDMATTDLIRILRRRHVILRRPLVRRCHSSICRSR